MAYRDDRPEPRNPSYPSQLPPSPPPIVSNGGPQTVDPNDPYGPPGTPPPGNNAPPTSSSVTNLGTNPMPTEMIGDIPPPPIPRAPRVSGPGIAGIPGTEGSTFAQPGTRAAVPFHTSAYATSRPKRFGPGVPTAGGATDVFGGSSDGASLTPEEAAEILRSMVAGRSGAQ